MSSRKGKGPARPTFSSKYNFIPSFKSSIPRATASQGTLTSSAASTSQQPSQSTGHNIIKSITKLQEGFRSLRLSKDSTSTIPTSLFYAHDLQLGAGCVMIQPSTGKVAIVWDTKHPEGYAFLPKGRKDVGESLEQAALREATEESGYECQFLPLDIPHHCPKGSAPSRNPSHEPIYVSVIHNGPHRRGHYIDPGTEYFTFWYIAQIAADAIPRDDTRMPDEQSYRTELLSYEQASAALFQFGTLEQLQVLNVAYDLWTQSLKDAESANRGGQSTGGQTTMMN